MTICLTALPPLPISMKNGIGGLLGRRLYTGLGSAGKRFYYLDMDDVELGWQLAQPFPGCDRNDAASVTTDTGIYVFSGAGKMDTDPHIRVLTDSYFFSKETQTWSKLDTTIPVGLLGASATSISDHQLIFIGGYCKETFDSLFARLSKVSSATDERSILDSFMSQPIEAYGWNPHIWMFDTRTLRWSKLADNPYLPNCGAGLIVKDQQILLIEGEIKPGLRSLETKRFQIKTDGSVECDLLPTIVQNEPKHEGIAGGFVGLIDNIPTVSGGAFFVGSQKRFQQGHLFSHQGLVKHYSNAIWQLNGSQWNKVGNLSDGQAYGVSVSIDNGIAILGGENQQGKSITDCFIMSN